MESENINEVVLLPIIEDPRVKEKKRSMKSRPDFRGFLVNHVEYFVILSIVFRLLGVIFFLIIFEFSFFFLLSNIGNDFLEIWILQTFVIGAFALFIFSTFTSSKFPFFKFVRVLSSLLMLILFGGLFILIMMLYESLISLKIVLGLLTSYYFVNLILFIKTNRMKILDVKGKTLALIFIIIVSCSSVIFFISITPRYIKITPKTEPEIIFWCGTSQLPDDSDILEKCHYYNIAFMPTIRMSYIGKDEYMQKYKKVLSYEVNLYFAIGGNSNFFAYIDNAKEFPVIYQNIREWFEEEGILDSPYIKSFSIDAEPPNEYIEYLNNGSIFETLDYGCDNYPTQEEIDEATKAYDQFASMVKDDGKQCGMIQASRFLDNADQDADISLFMRNIYSLPIEWDFSITMLYRTNQFQEDESEDTPQEFLMNSFSIFYGAVIEGTKFTTSELSFYQNVALEENSKDDLADEHYIFVGDLEKEFKNTKYVKDREYLKDIDICRHFGNDKVFLYDLNGFVYHYGWGGIEALGRHIQKKQEWYLEYDTYKSITFLAFYCGLIIIDIFASLEKDLT